MVSMLFLERFESLTRPDKRGFLCWSRTPEMGDLFRKTHVLFFLVKRRIAKCKIMYLRY
jgi:hypothetical protein